MGTAEPSKQKAQSAAEKYAENKAVSGCPDKSAERDSRWSPLECESCGPAGVETCQKKAYATQEDSKYAEELADVPQLVGHGEEANDGDDDQRAPCECESTDVRGPGHRCVALPRLYRTRETTGCAFAGGVSRPQS